jgi:hypothetical protein
MAKSMRVPVLVFESMRETEILLEGLKLVTSKGGSHKKKVTGHLINEIQKINSTMAMTNKN